MPLPRKAIVRSTPSRVRSSPDDYVNRLNGLDVVQHCLLTGLLPAVSRGPRQTRVRSERRTRATARTSNVNASHNQTYMDRLAPEEYFISTILDQDCDSNRFEATDGTCLTSAPRTSCLFSVASTAVGASIPPSSVSHTPWADRTLAPVVLRRTASPCTLFSTSQTPAVRPPVSMARGISPPEVARGSVAR